MKKVLLSWSSGKDCAWSLHLLRQQPDIEVVALLTTLNGVADRVAMHGVRRELLEAQADRARLPLWAVDLPWPCSNADYEERMRTVCERATAEGIASVAFGDLFPRRHTCVPRPPASGNGSRAVVPRLANPDRGARARNGRKWPEGEDYLRRSSPATCISRRLGLRPTLSRCSPRHCGPVWREWRIPLVRI